MSDGRCLCGSVRWTTLAEPYAMYNCHCRMCQKLHGAAFGTYGFFKSDQLRWTTPTDSVVEYASSESVVRSSCGVCGSVVPVFSQTEEYWIAPAGCHDDLRKPDYNIFVADNAPWHTISGDLPRCDEYPPESGMPAVAGIPAPAKATGPLHGSCLCGMVTYQLTEPLVVAHNCHCARCRQGRSAAHATNGFVSFNGLQFLTGEDRLMIYKVPEAKFFTQIFCDTCSSLMPRKDEQRGITVLPLSSLDHDPEIKPIDHIYVEYKAGWHDITDGLPQHSEGPPPR